MSGISETDNSESGDGTRVPISSSSFSSNCEISPNMNFAMIVAVTIFLSRRLIRCQECNAEFFKTAFPDPDYIIYGMREDTNIVLLPSDILNNTAIINKLPNLLDDDTSSKQEIEHHEAMLIEVHGLLQFITIWQEYVSTGKLYTITRLSYFEAFRLVFVPTIDKIVYKAMLTTLMYFSDLSKSHFVFKTTKDSELFLHQQGHGILVQYQIIFGRAGTKLFIQKIKKIITPWVEPIANIMAINKKTSKWLARSQKSPTPQLDCVVETKSKFGVGILYGRKNLVDAYYEMGDSSFDCNNQKCREQLRNNGGKIYHDKEVNAIHKKGSIYLGFRNGYIFTYRIINEKEKFSEILFSLDLAHRVYKDGVIGKGDDLHLFSVDGKEAIAVICGPITYYRIYNTNPRNGIKIINLKKSDMTIIKPIKKKCRKVDYDAKHAKLIFFIDSSTAHELKLTFNHDGILKTYPDPKLNRFDNYRGNVKPFEGIESQWPLHLRNGRTLFYNPNSKQRSVTHKKILTNYGNYVNALSYFPNEYIEDEYMELFRNDTEKYPISFYGVANCTVFVIMKFEDLEKVNLKGGGCDKSYEMRAILLDSHITVLRTKDGIKVEGVRIKASVNYEDVEKAIKKEGVVAYTHNLMDSEFEESNSFIIAPNTFHTIHNIDVYTYYQYKPRTGCTYHFRRRKITKGLKKDVRDSPFPALAVSHKQIMKPPCDFEISSAMYDESVPGVVYVMRRKIESALATPNVVISDILKQVQSEKFMADFIYSTSLPYVLYNDSKGASVLSVENPDDIKITFNATFDFIGIYMGKILYRAAEVAYILGSEIEAVEERINDTFITTKALPKREFEKAAFGIESEIIGRPEVHTKRCRLINAPFFMAFILKIAVLDMLLLFILIILVIYHRAHIIPARRRFKIKMGILKHRKKRKLRDRARRRLRKLNLLRRRRKKIQQEGEAKRQAALIAAAVGALGVAEQEKAAEGKKKSSSSSSSDLVTAGESSKKNSSHSGVVYKTSIQSV
ncbi:Threonine--tRNA ligase [Dirofilaria immitis]